MTYFPMRRVVALVLAHSVKSIQPILPANLQGLIQVQIEQGGQHSSGNVISPFFINQCPMMQGRQYIVVQECRAKIERIDDFLYKLTM